MDTRLKTAQTVFVESYPPGVLPGCDVIRQGRVAAAIHRRGPGFAALLFDGPELAEGVDLGRPTPEARFGLKESTLKALGRGLSGALNLKDVSTVEGRIQLGGATASLAGQVEIQHEVSKYEGHVVTWVWLVPTEEDRP